MAACYDEAYMTKITKVNIIYNPNSTGSGKKNAEELRDALETRGVEVTLVETTHAKHAIELARNLAEADPSCMIISSSGDGGYHEVINGVLNSKNPMTITGVLPSGNANDHYHFVHYGETLERIVSGDVAAIDVLKVTTPQWTHYAHSYAGLGLSPQIGEELTKATLNPLTEAWLVVTRLFKVRGVKVRYNNHVNRYDHIVFSNSGRMSKYLTLSSEASVTDGKFEVTQLESGSMFQLLKHLLHSATLGADDTPQQTSFRFQVLRSTTMQLDGEVYDIAAGSTVLIESIPGALHCIV
jgi:diacylglycerol kinase family enzyme